MTGSQPLLIWLMTACLIATPVSRQIQPKPFYHAAAARYRQRLQAETPPNLPLKKRRYNARHRKAQAHRYEPKTFRS